MSERGTQFLKSIQAQSWIITLQDHPERLERALATKAAMREAGYDCCLWLAFDNRKGWLESGPASAYKFPLGMIGIYLSHYMLWQAWMQMCDEEWILIMEDDAVWVPDPETAKSAIMDFWREADALQLEPKMIYLGGIECREHPTQLGEKIMKPDYLAGIYGYGVHRSVVEASFHIFREMTFHFDNLVVENLHRGIFKDQVFAIHPYVIVEAGFQSTLYGAT